MITQFDSLFAGHIDMDNVGYAGTAVNDRRFSNAELAAVFEAGVAQYAAEGWADQWRLHHQGGLTGYAGREIFATAASRHRLEAGQAVAWNPSITRVKSEDTALATSVEPEVLTRSGSWPERTIDLETGSIARPWILEV